MQLTWTRKKEWGSAGMTYRAETQIGDKKVRITVDSPNKGHWAMRAWVSEGIGNFRYREANTMVAAKAQAQELVDELFAQYRAEGKDRMAAAVALVEAARARVQFRADTCGCKTPLHTMRCGVGGVVTVVTKSCRECGRQSGHKLDCGTGRTITR